MKTLPIFIGGDGLYDYLKADIEDRLSITPIQLEPAIEKILNYADIRKGGEGARLYTDSHEDYPNYFIVGDSDTGYFSILHYDDNSTETKCTISELKEYLVKYLQDKTKQYDIIY